MPESPKLRIADAEREQASEALRRHFAAGRIDEQELADRIDAVFAARTHGELARMLEDLPELPAVARHAQLERRSRLRRELAQQSGAATVPFLVCVVIWFAAGARGEFWPVWVLFAVLFPLLRGGWALYGPAPDLDRVEAELEHRRRGGPYVGEHRRRRLERRRDQRARRQP